MSTQDEIKAAVANNEEYTKGVEPLFKKNNINPELMKQLKAVDDLEKQLRKSNDALSELEAKCESNLEKIHKK